MRKLVAFVPASSLTLGIGQDFNFTNGGGSMPAVCVNFPPLWAEALVEAVLRPFAKPSDCYVGLKQNGDCFEVSAYCVVNVPTPIQIRLEGLNVPDHGTFVLGTDADIPIDGVIRFMEHRIRSPKHEYFLTVGINDPRSIITRALTGRWKVTLETMRDDLKGDLERRLGIPPSDLIVPK